MKEAEILRKIEFPKIWTSRELMETDFPEPNWIVPGLIPEGLTLIAGAPKMGKSWFALQLAGAVSVGTQFLKEKTSRIETLYIALEDTERRLKRRLDSLEILPDENLQIITRWARGDMALTWLKAYKMQSPDIGCIIIDTLAHIRAGVDGNDYDETTAELSRLKQFADEFGLSIILIHHTRKMQADDYLHTVSGSVGITGTADTILTITRGRGSADAVLNATGRDIEERELALSFESETGKWTLEGNAADLQKTRERQEIFDILKDNAEPLGPKELAIAAGKNPGAVKMLLSRMVSEGSVRLVSRGKYLLNTCYFSDLVTSNTDDSAKHIYHNELDTIEVNPELDLKVTPYKPTVTITQSNKVTEVTPVLKDEDIPLY